MNKKKLGSLLFWLIVTVVPIAGIIVSLANPASFKESQEVWQNKMLTLGVLAPLAFVFLQIIQVVITPINHYAVSVLGGFLFGPFWGTILNWIGRSIGHIIAFFIARTLGREIARKFVSQKTLEKYNRHVSNKSFLLFLFYVLPFFPDDELSYLVGLSKMKTKPFILSLLFGQIGGSLTLAYIGSGIDSKDWFFWLLVLLTFIGFAITWLELKKKTTN